MAVTQTQYAPGSNTAEGALMSAADTSFEELWARAAQITAVEATATLRDAQHGRDQHGPNLGAALR